MKKENGGKKEMSEENKLTCSHLHNTPLDSFRLSYY